MLSPFVMERFWPLHVTVASPSRQSREWKLLLSAFKEADFSTSMRVTVKYSQEASRVEQ